MTGEEFSHPLLRHAVPFVRSLGLTVRPGVVSGNPFLPGILIQDGALVVDEAALTYPSDLLHEAGHLAVMDPGVRASAQAAVDATPAEEMAAMAWSYAAACALRLPPRELFHDGYKAGGQAMADAFERQAGPGVPMLAYWGMTVEPHRARQQGVAGFPTMIRWLR